ncbi:MAG: ParB/RepB/Spo0J family partition protein [Parasporobacterium sp.]|nr:ParB/RepB/Spo0J family partition protein [Parasporobacterium sp.]
MSEFIQIDINDLIPHPDNPRKDLGDLAELTESIRKNGILQNLTVVKDGDKYKVIIGHRRLAAAKAAGLTELPCTVADMDERQQLCTMMEENMQRQDLTIPEQAYGFQYMLDLGETVSSIAKKTGFSEQTVKHRLEIAKLSKKVVKYADKYGDWQMSIKDYIELEKIKDIKTREKIIKENRDSQWRFRNSIWNAVDEEKRKATKAKWLPLLDAAGIKEAETGVDIYNGTHTIIKEIDLDGPKVPKKLILRSYDKNEPLVWKERFRSIYILQKRKKEPEKLTPAEIKRKEAKNKQKKLRKIELNLLGEMQRYVGDIFSGTVDEPPASAEMDVLRDIWNAFFDFGEWLTLDTRKSKIVTDKEYFWELSKKEKEELRKKMAAKRTSTQFLTAMAGEWKDKRSVIEWNGSYHEENGKKEIQIYELLHKWYGFEFSRPEYLRILDGTNEDYRRDGNE